jgi:peptide-methionine (S)-S-oxide reductase
MRNLWRGLLAMAVLTAALAIGASRNKSAADAARYEKATLAGGCFWSLQETLRQIPGVVKTTVGYTGGTLPNPTYEQVAAGSTGHAEAVEVVFDPARLSYGELVADFLAARNPAQQPTSAHRPAIFYHDEGQRQAAERVTDTINQSGKWSSPLIVEISPATEFYPAEEYHQDYFRKMSAARNCGLE